MLKPKTKVIILGITVALFIALPLLSEARGLVPCGGYEDDGVTREAPCTVVDVFVLIARVTNWLIMVAGIYAVFQIIAGAWFLVASVGSEETITKRKNQITQAVVGFALVLCAYMFVNTAVNILFLRNIQGCTIDLRNPLIYFQIDESKCNPK